MFYGRENSEKRGFTEFYTRAQGGEAAKKDPFALHLEEHQQLRKMYLEAEVYLEAEDENAYYSDQSVFGDEISIDDAMGVLHMRPWKGSDFRAVFNGTEGRLELGVVEQSYANSVGGQEAEGASEKSFGESGGEDRFGRAADHIDGVRSILAWIAANRSLRTEGVVLGKDILDLKY